MDKGSDPNIFIVSEKIEKVVKGILVLGLVAEEPREEMRKERETFHIMITLFIA